MLNKSGNNRWYVANKIFTDNFIVASLIEFSIMITALVDGLVVSRLLAPGSMASFGLARPYFSIIAIFFGFMTTGMQTLCSEKIGRGDAKNFNRIFFSAFYISGIISIVLASFFFFFSYPFALFLGNTKYTGTLILGTSNYIRGLSIGLPATMLNAILLPAIQMDSGRKRVLVSIYANFVCDVILDLVVVYTGHGLFGIGLASSLSRYVKLTILLLHFRDKNHLLRFTGLHTSFREFFTLLSFGTEKIWYRLGSIVRPIFINKIILLSGGTIALTAMSIRITISDLTEIFAIGLADTVGLVAGVYFGEKNAEAMEEMGKTVHRLCLRTCIVLSVIIALFSWPISLFFTNDHGSLLSLTQISLIGVALQTPLKALLRARITYLQRIQKTKTMQTLIILGSMVFPISAALILKKFFGIYGLLFCYTAGDFLSLTAVWLYHVFTTKKLFPRANDYLSLPDSFHIKPEDIISLDIRNMDDISVTTEQISLFCKGHHLSPQLCSHVAVCFEEMAANTVKHGFPLNKTYLPIIDLRVTITDGKLVIRMLDNCPQYDAGKRLKALENAGQKEKMSNLGSWLTQNFADDVRYIYSFECNTIIMEFKITKS